MLTCFSFRFYSIYFSGDFVLWKIDTTDTYVEVRTRHSFIVRIRTLLCASCQNHSVNSRCTLFLLTEIKRFISLIKRVRLRFDADVRLTVSLHCHRCRCRPQSILSTNTALAVTPPTATEISPKSFNRDTSVLSYTDLVEAADNSLFQRILDNDSHILSSPLPPKSDNHYNLRKKHHDRKFLQKQTLICSTAILLFVCSTKAAASRTYQSQTYSNLHIIDILFVFIFHVKLRSITYLGEEYYE